MKKLAIIFVAIIALIVLAGIAKDSVVKISVEKGIEVITWLRLSIRSVNVGILKTIVRVKDLKLANPAGFPDPTMVDMPEIYVHYDLPAILGGTVHLPEARLALKEFVVVKNEKGELNLNALTTVRAQRKGKAPAQETPGKAPAIQIDRLSLSIGKVIYKDYSRGGAPTTREFNINLNESFSNVDNPYTLASLIVVKALMNTPIAWLANFDLKGLQGTVGDTLASAQKIVAAAGDVQKTIATSQESAKQAVRAATESAKKAQEAAQQTADTVKDLFKNPFGSDK